LLQGLFQESGHTSISLFYLENCPSSKLKLVTKERPYGRSKQIIKGIYF